MVDVIDQQAHATVLFTLTASSPLGNSSFFIIQVRVSTALNMLNHAATQANLEILKKRGVRVVEPGGG